MDGQSTEENIGVSTELCLAIASPAGGDLGDVLDVQLGLEPNTNTGNTTGDASAAAAEQENDIGGLRTAARHSSKKRRHNSEQIVELEAAFRENQLPDEDERMDLGKRIGMTEHQVKFWFQNRRTSQKTQEQRLELRELKEAKRALETERQAIKAATLNNICLTCGGPTLHEPQQHLLSEIERLKNELHHATEFIQTLLATNRNLVAGGAGKALATNRNVFRGAGKALAIDHTPPPPAHRAHAADPTMRAVSEGSARSQGDTNAMLIHFASHALNEFWALFCLGTPMWLPAPGGEVEMLNLQQYIHTMIPSVFGPYRVGFAVDGTRKTGDVMCAARNLVSILMDAALWSDVFPGIVGSASASRIIVAPGSASSSSQNGTLLLMDADLRVLSPRVPIRKVKFVRQCQEVQPGKWAVVDVSVDGILGVPPAHITCRLRPSGCLIEERNDSSCKVTWIMNMEYNDANVFPLYHPLLRSGKALGACRWLVSLQRYCEHLDILHAYTVPALSNTGDITPIVRKNIFEVAHRMTKSLYEAMCVPWSQPWRTYNEWSSECGIGVKRFKVVARILTFSAGSGAPREQAAGAIVLRASTPIWLPGIPAQQVFGYLCDEKRRGEWDSLANDAPVLQEVCFATGKLPGNAVSVLRTAASDGTKGKLILQEVCADTSCMVLAYSTLDEQFLQNAMTSGDHHASLSLLPSGLVILPDCASPVSAACSSSAAVNAGCFVSAIYQTQLNAVQPPEELFFEDARNNAGNLLCRVISKIKDAVHANFAVHAA